MSADHSSRLILRFLGRLAGSFERAGQMRTLAELTDDQLRDIGVSRRQVDRAARRPFWRR